MILNPVFLKTLESLKEMPGLYLGGRSLLALRHFVRGYLAREEELGIKHEQGINLNDFQKYIENLYNLDNTSKDCFTLVYDLSEDKDNALDLFFKLFDDYSGSVTHLN